MCAAVAVDGPAIVLGEASPADADATRPAPG
jgi:hypothetical protein